MAEDGSPKMAPAPQRQTRDLNAAIATCFSPYLTAPPFPQRLVELVAALTNSRSVSLWSRPQGEEDPALFASTNAPTPETVLNALRAEPPDATASGTPGARFTDGYLLADIAMPDGQTATLALTLPAGGPGAQSVTYERVTTLSHLSFAQFRNPDMVEQAALTTDLHKIAAGDTTHLQPLVDRLARISGADYAAAGMWRSGALTQLTISGQDKFTKRALLPDKLRGQLQETAQQSLSGRARSFAAIPNREDGLVLLLEKPTRAPAVLPLAAALFAQSDHGRRPGRSWAKLARYAAFALVLVGIGMIPIPDGVRINATTEALNKRIVTAPFTTVIQSIDVEEGVPVRAGQIIATLDTQEIDIELTGLRSERAAAVIEQETARLNANAASLRNAELAVAQFNARIELLETRKASAEIKAQIDGIAVLDNLKQRIGTTVRQGDPLMEISDAADVTLTLTVLESDIGKVVAGDAGQFRPDFDPTATYPATVTSVSPAIDVTAEVPSATAFATFDVESTGLRPGLTGLLLVGDVRRPIWQVLYNNLRDWVLLRVWF